MRSPPAGLPAPVRANFQALRSDENPGTIKSNLFITLAPIRLMEIVPVPMESGESGRAPYENSQNINFYSPNRHWEQFVKAPLLETKRKINAIKHGAELNAITFNQSDQRQTLHIEQK